MRTFPSWRARSASRELAKHIIFRAVDGIQVSGPDSADYAVGYGADRRRVYAIREEIDLEHWTAELPGDTRDQARAELGLRGCVFTNVGRYWRGKGLGVLIDAFQSLAMDRPECTLLLVGSGPEERALRAAAVADSRIVLHGFASPDRLRELYRASDVFVFPTLGDPYGHVVQEAMASGLPVISSTAAGDIKDRVIEGVTGFLVPPGDSTALADRMAVLAGDMGRRVEMGQRGRERIAGWSTELWAEAFEEMVFDVIARARRR